MLDVAPGARVPPLLLTATSNLADWPPGNANIPERLYADLPGFPARLAAIEAALRAGRLEGAAEQLAQARALRADDAALDYWEGALSRARGDSARARELFLRARDRDPLPWRIPSEANEFLRRAASREGVVLVDAEAALAAAAPGGLVGLPLVVDNAHLTDRGGDVVAVEILRRIAAAGLGVPETAEALRLPAEARLRAFRADARAKAKRDLDAQVL